MNDFEGLLTSDFGFKPQGKSAPMAPSKASANATQNSTLNFGIQSHGATRSSRNSNSLGGSFVDDHDSMWSTSNRKTQDFGNLDGFGDVLGGPTKYTSMPETRGGDSGFNFDSMLRGSTTDSGSKSSTLPVYDKPVYDDDFFDGVPGLKSSTSVKYDDVFSSISSPAKGNGAFDDLLGSLGGAGPKSKSFGGKGSGGAEKGVGDFDDLLIPGFGGSSPSGDRSTSEASWPQKSTVNATKTTSNVMEDPFVVLEPTSNPVAPSSGPFTDPLEEISKLSKSGSSRVDGSFVSGGVSDHIDPLDGLGRSVPAFSSKLNDRGKDRSPLKTGSSMTETQTSASKESIEKSSVRSPEGLSQKKMPVENYWESHQTLFDMPTVSNGFPNSVRRSGSPPSYINASPNGTDSQVNMPSTSEENLESYEDVWLTVSEFPLFTQPTSAPPPSRPPPPRPAKVSKAEKVSRVSTNARKKVNESSSFPTSTRYESPKLVPATTRSSVVSQIDELEGFAMGRARNNVDGRADVLSGEEMGTNSDAATSAAAMKEAMDRAEAKFRHAKEVRERENAKAARSKEAVQLEKDEKAMQDAQDRVLRERQQRLERERQQREREEEEGEQRGFEQERERVREIEREREEKEREQRRLEKETERAREIEREREKVRQAVERATKEARERAAAESRLKAERAAVQRAQAEARERAAADAKQRAEKAAAEARERANAEAREKEARERAAVVRAEADARLRAERAAVQRAASEARERAAAESRERANASAKVNQQKNEDDLESFFSMGGRPSSAPRPRANTSDPPSDTPFQNRQGPEAARRTSVGSSSSLRKASSTTNIVDDLTSIFGAVPSSGEFQEVEGETEERRRARLERHQRTEERAAKALAEKNQRDLQALREQAERHRISETIDAEIKRWSTGKEGNLRALLSTLQYVLWPECGWQPVALTDLITGASVKKVYRKATLCIHPDKVQQKGANLQQKYIAEKVFDLLKEAWNKFNSEELF